MTAPGGAYAAFRPELHPRDSHGRFRDKWGLPASAKKLVDGIVNAFRPMTGRSDEELQAKIDGHAGKKKRTPKQKAALDSFTSNGFAPVQADLRAGKTNADAKEMDSMMEPLPEDMFLTRVMGAEAFGLPPQRIGEVEEWTGKLVADKGFAPTNVGTPFPVGGPHVTMSIMTPKGTPAVIPGGSREVILDRDQPLRIVKVDSDGRGGVYVYAVAQPKGARTRALGRGMRAGEKAPAVDATPDELEKRGLQEPAGAPGVNGGPPAPGVDAPATPLAGAPDGTPESAAAPSPLPRNQAPQSGADVSAPNDDGKSGQADGAAPSEPAIAEREAKIADREAKVAAREEKISKLRASKKAAPNAVAQAAADMNDDDLNAEQIDRWGEAVGAKPKLPQLHETMLAMTAEQIRKKELTKAKASEQLRDLARDKDSPADNFLRQVADIIDSGAEAKKPRAPRKKAAPRAAKREGEIKDLREAVAARFPGKKAAPKSEPKKAEPELKAAPEKPKTVAPAVKKAAPEKAAPAADGDLNKMLVKDLRALAAERGVKLGARDRKADIVEKLGGKAPAKKAPNADMKAPNAAKKIDVPAKASAPATPAEPGRNGLVGRKLSGAQLGFLKPGDEIEVGGKRSKVKSVSDRNLVELESGDKVTPWGNREVKVISIGGGDKKADAPAVPAKKAVKAEPPKPVTLDERRAQRAAAREQQQRIAAANVVGHVAALVSELEAKDADSSTIAKQLRGLARGPEMEEVRDPALRGALRVHIENMANKFEHDGSGHLDMMDLMGEAGVRVTGFDADKDKLESGLFDPDKYDTDIDSIEPGDKVQVVRPGAKFKLGHETIILFKPKVVRAVEPKKAATPPAARGRHAAATGAEGFKVPALKKLAKKVGANPDQPKADLVSQVKAKEALADLDSGPGVWTENELMAMDIGELRKLANAHGEEVRGFKGDIAARLIGLRKAKPQVGPPAKWRREELKKLGFDELVHLMEQNGKAPGHEPLMGDMVNMLVGKPVAPKGPVWEEQQLDKMFRGDIQRILRAHGKDVPAGLDREELVKRAVGLPVKSPKGQVMGRADRLDELDAFDLDQLGRANGVKVPFMVGRAELMELLEENGIVHPDSAPEMMKIGQLRLHADAAGIRIPKGATKEEALEIIRNPPVVEFHQKVPAGLKKLIASVAGGIKENNKIAEGQMGDTSKVELNDGSSAIRKAHKLVFGMPAIQQADGEQLASVLGKAIDAPVPHVFRQDAKTIFMEFVQGKTAYDSGFDAQVKAIEDPSGIRLGLLDALIGNGDRHANNWMITPDGKPMGIDHGLAWAPPVAGKWSGEPGSVENGERRPGPTRGVFSDRFASSGEWKDQIDVSKQEMKDLRVKMEALRPQFILLDREDWLDISLQRMDAIIKRAKNP